jgi:hypothetical protein
VWRGKVQVQVQDRIACLWAARMGAQELRKKW